MLQRSQPKPQALHTNNNGTESRDRTGFSVIHAHEGQTLAYRGGRADSLYLVQSGSVEIFKGSELSENASERRVLGPGSVVGEVGFGADNVAEYTMRLEKTALLRFDDEGVGIRLRQSLGQNAAKLKKLLGIGEELIVLA